MKASELRIGNYIQYKWGELAVVASLDGYVDTDKVNDEPFDDYYDPIPLTKEWIINFSLDKQVTINGNFYQAYETKFHSFDYETKFYAWQLSRNGEGLGPMHHVHQLQNLYFALTGEELTICSSS